MKIIGHELVKFEPFFECLKEQDISANRENLFAYEPNMIKRAQKMEANFSLKTDDIVQIILANAAGAKFIIVSRKLASKAAKIAQNYLFDAQIAVIIKNEREIEDLSEAGVDAVIFEKGICNGDI
ncbi:hypothetical protein [Campylobacter sp.]|uniref:hypothetical protein n=1 Tax=Campylobacter sp. TaxID=205 RepID=UPI0027095B18|nr:hypothetical protein [Campylobacter sp.]